MGDYGSRLVTEWRSTLVHSRGDNKPPDASLLNAINALQMAPQWQGVLGFDVTAQSIVQTGTAPWDTDEVSEPRPWSDVNTIRVTEWLQSEGIMVISRTAREAIARVAADNQFSPVQKYLSGLAWDGTPRLDKWISRYCGAEDAPFTRMAGRKWMISAVARAMSPGCQADYMLILEGPQGIGKSKAASILGGQWFTDDMRNIENKDASAVVARYWIIEFSEMKALRRSNSDTIKAFLTRREEKYRPPYGHEIVEHRRQCVFMGTINPEGGYLTDAENRRYWPVWCPTAVAADDLARDRNQLWAEAKVAYENGETWWPDTSMQALATIEQEKRRETDPWAEPIGKIIDNIGAPTHAMSLPGPGVTMHEIMNQLDLPSAQRTRREELRIAMTLRTMGFVRWKVPRDGPAGRKYVAGYIHGSDAGDGLENVE